MPPNVQGQPTMVEMVPDGGYDYKYPHGLNLKPGSPLHTKILNEVNRRARDSRDAMSHRYSSWRKIDRTLTAYIPLDEEEKLIKSQDSRKPVSIVVPLSFATLQTLLAYWMGVFYQRPMFQLDPEGPEDTPGAILLEHIVDMQMQRYRAGEAICIAGRDAAAYGLAVTTPVWTRKLGMKTITQDTGYTSFTGEFVKTGTTQVRNEVLKFEGNEIQNIDPYDYLPDPGVPVHKPEKGEYAGWICRENLMGLLMRERESDYGIFNVKYLKHRASCRSTYSMEQSRTSDRLGSIGNVYSSAGHPVDVVYMYIRLIPKDWGLSSYDYPQDWIFGVAGDAIVIQADPTDLDHQEIPMTACAPDTDGRSLTPLGRLEVIYGLQESVDWLMNSHQKNVRKAINDMIIYDPSILNSTDIENPNAGKLIRVRPNAFGRNIREAIMQLPVNDVTRQNIGDVQVMMEIIQQVTGAVDIMQGIIKAKSGERRTAEEVQAAKQAAVSRLQMMCQMAGLQMFQRLGYLCAEQTQQLMSQQAWIRAIGRHADELRAIYGDSPMIPVTPQDIQVGFDVVVRDGSTMTGSGAAEYLQFLQVAGTNPELNARIDVVRIAQEWLRRTGVKNVRDFERRPMQMTVMPTPQVEAGAQAGNLVPIGEAA